jgi:hypothetical protein
MSAAAAIADLTRDFAREAAAITSVYAGQAAQCLACDDEPGAERALAIVGDWLRVVLAAKQITTLEPRRLAACGAFCVLGHRQRASTPA